MKGLPVTLAVVAFLRASAAADFPGGKLVDLTHPFDQDTIFWPTESGFELEKGHEGKTEGGFWYAANQFCTPEHGGTHIDAPIHFYEDRRTVDEIPLEQLFGSAVVVDVSKKVAADRDYQVRIDDFRDWEKSHGEIPGGAIVLIRTGYWRHWSDRERYLGTKERGDGAVAMLHFPGLHAEGARWLVEKRSIKAVGIDTASIDHGQSKRFETHVALFEKNVPAFENLANLGQLPPNDLFVVALPMKIRGGSGGPLRIVAVIKEI